MCTVHRYALLALRHGNVKNQAEIITTVRANSLLARDLRKLDYASDLLRFEDSTPVKAPYSLGYRVSEAWHGEDFLVKHCGPALCPSLLMFTSSLRHGGLGKTGVPVCNKPLKPNVSVLFKK